MAIQPASLLLYLTSIILASLAACLWRHRTQPIGRFFIGLLLSTTIYAFGYGMEISSLSLPTILFWSKIQYIGLPYIAVFYLLVAVAYVGKKSLLKTPVMIFLFGIPTITFIVHLTMQYHNLFYIDPWIETGGPFPVLTFGRGPWYIIQAVYNNLCIVAGTVLYIIYYFRGSAIFRRQIGIMVLGSMITWISQIIYISRLFSYNIDLTPFASGLTGIILSIGVLKYKLINLSPVARDRVFDFINEGILVFDIENRLIDFNPTSAKIFPYIHKNRLGSDGSILFKNYAVLNSLLTDPLKEKKSTEITIEMDGGHHHFHVRVIQLKTGKSLVQGNLLVFNDISEHKQLLLSLEKFATTDALTDIYNRRYFLELAERELLRSKRNSDPFSVLIFDIDHFKRINDTYGHTIGDNVLVHITDVVEGMVREIDIFGRYGGEEFITVLSGTKPAEALIIAERIREKLEQNPIEIEGAPFIVTASFGVSGTEGERQLRLADYIEEADSALYQAKNSGRNCVVLYKPVL
jgi:diguanylate cyclase (GGDEF)-like protein